MRLRVFLVFATLMLGFFLTVSPASAAKPPRCYGKVATQWLTEPGELYGTSGDDVLVGSNGDDILDTRWDSGHGGVDLICGGGGNDFIYLGGFAGSKANGGNGQDSVYAYGDGIAHGGPGDDSYIYAFGANSFAYGDSGDDAVVAFYGGTADGGSGNDIVEYDTASSQPGHIYGGSGNDHLKNFSSVTTVIDCGPGADRVESNGALQVRRCEMSEG